MWRFKAKINRLITWAVLRLIPYICNQKGSGFDLWYLLTSLRSFDGALPTDDAMLELKNLTTERIRAVAGFNHGSRLKLHRELPLSLEEQDRRDQLLNQAGRHFKNHYLEAVMAIRCLYGYDLKTEEPWKPVWKS